LITILIKSNKQELSEALNKEIIQKNHIEDSKHKLMTQSKKFKLNGKEKRKIHSISVTNKWILLEIDFQMDMIKLNY